MTPEQLEQIIKKKLEQIKQVKKEVVPHIIGKEAVQHYEQSFANEGFTDKTLKKWKDVKRRDPKSPWYGFQLGNKNNFSPTRASDKILTGSSKELQNSIRYVVKTDRVTVSTDKPYAAVHQFGLNSKIFGKKTFKQTPRPFIGKSEVLEKKITQKIEDKLNKIINE